MKWNCETYMSILFLYYSLHLTTMCLQYKPTVVACFCIHLACKWSRWEVSITTRLFNKNILYTLLQALQESISFQKTFVSPDSTVEWRPTLVSLCGQIRHVRPAQTADRRVPSHLWPVSHAVKEQNEIDTGRTATSGRFTRFAPQKQNVRFKHESYSQDDSSRRSSSAMPSSSSSAIARGLDDAGPSSSHHRSSSHSHSKQSSSSGEFPNSS